MALSAEESTSLHDKPMRVLVIGAGSISREFALRHFTPSSTGTIVAGIVDLDEGKAMELAADVGSAQAGAEVRDANNNKYRAAAQQRCGTPVPHFTSPDAALDEGTCGSDGSSSTDTNPIDIVYIGTTPNSHRVLVEAALKRGKHVLLEKPLAATKEDADAIVAAVEGASPNLVVGMNIGMRYNEALLEMKRHILELKELGSAAQYRGSLRTHFAQWPREWQTQPWCAGWEEGGPLREVGTHFFSALLEFSGAHDDSSDGVADAREPVTARIRANVQYPDGDTSSEISQQQCETFASGEILLMGGLLPRNGLVVDLSVRTDAPRDLYELAISAAAEDGDSSATSTAISFTLYDFCSLRTESGDILVRNAPYGRRECVLALVAAAKENQNQNQPYAANIPSIVTARHGRNAQQMLDAILESNGKWIEVEFE